MRLRRLIEFSIFLAVFSSIYFMLNFFILRHITTSLGLSGTVLWWSVVLTLAIPASYWLEKSIPSLASRVFFTVVSTWMGMIFILGVMTLAVELIRYVLPIPAYTVGMVILTHGVALSVYAIIKGFILRIETHELRMTGLKHTVRIVQLSDVHIGTIRNGPYLQRIARKVNALHPDIVVITGDLVDGSAPLHDGMVRALNSIKAPVYCITGNHEVYEDLSLIMPILERTKMRTLRNEMVHVNGIQLIGLDYTTNPHQAAAALHRLRINKERPSVLLYHIPELTSVAAKAGVRLQLSGHTHNGQIWPFTLLVRIVHKYTCGSYDIAGMRLYVSPGTGMWGPPMRLGSHNEITLHILTPA